MSTTFVLVHGAWSGAHSYHLVRPLLQGGGHAVFTPSLTGLGERSHLASPLVNLSTHVRDVVNLVLFEDLRDIVLVGHSYGGMVVTGCIDHIADRIRHLVYLDAFVPRNGESLHSIRTGGPAEVELRVGDEWLERPPDRDLDDPDEAAWVQARRVPHPVGCFTEPVTLRRPLEEHEFTLTYIKATADARDASPGSGAFWDAADLAKSDERWRYREIATNHMVQHNKPEDLAEMLLEVAAG